MVVADSNLDSIAEQTAKQDFAQQTYRQHCESLSALGQRLYGHSPQLYVRSPGRLEILGNHTDYNMGFALTCAIGPAIYFGFSPREDRTVRCFSSSFPDLGVQSFSLDEITPELTHTWIDYLKGVIVELHACDVVLKGVDIVLESTLPPSGGISSSAALECGLALGLSRLFGGNCDAPFIAQLCQRAENNYVKSPCGFLDQAGVALSRHDEVVFIDFQPDEHNTLPIQNLTTGFEEQQLSFVMAVDPSVQRNLAATGYPARRKMCEDSLAFWSEKLERKVASLREVSVAQFEQFGSELKAIDPVMHDRVKHVVYENQRVLDAVDALKTGHVQHFGQLMTESGHSAIDLYELAEGVPQLASLLDSARLAPGVVGVRNMGGGFSVVILALVESQKVSQFTTYLEREYAKIYPQGKLDLICVAPNDGTDVLCSIDG